MRTWIIGSATALGCVIAGSAAAQPSAAAPAANATTMQGDLSGARTALMRGDSDAAAQALRRAAATNPANPQMAQGIREARTALWFGDNTAQATTIVDGMLGVRQAAMARPGPNSTPLGYVEAARAALAQDHDAQAATDLARADVRAGQNAPMIQQIGEARTALWFGDNSAQATTIVDGLLAANASADHLGTGVGASAGSASGVGSSGGQTGVTGRVSGSY